MAELNCPNCGREVTTLRVQFECSGGHTWGEVVDRNVTDKDKPQEAKPKSTLKMPFGKHKGTPLDELDLSYITWILENLTDLRPELREELENQVLLRQGKGVVRKEVVKEGLKFTFK